MNKITYCEEVSKMREKAFFLIFVLVLPLLFTNNILAASKEPSKIADLALYEGANRQQILEEGAKKEKTLTFYT